MRIQTIRASNYLNLRARVIEIPGTTNAVVIAGPNGSGKTALLDGIRAVLDGTLPRGFQYKKDLSALITDGEKDGFFGVTVKRDDHSGAELKLNLKSGTGTNPLLEPLAILVIGSVIGVIMIGIILAITSANDIAV